MTGILAGMMVAFKQIKPEEELSPLPLNGLRVKVGLRDLITYRAKLVTTDLLRWRALIFS